MLGEQEIGLFEALQQIRKTLFQYLLADLGLIIAALMNDDLARKEDKGLTSARLEMRKRGIGDSNPLAPTTKRNNLGLQTDSCHMTDLQTK